MTTFTSESAMHSHFEAPTQTSSRSVSTATAVSVLFVSMLLFVAIGIGFSLFGVDPTDYHIAVLLIANGSLSLAIPVATAMLYRPYDLFHPLNFVALSLFFGVFGRVIFLLTSSSPSVAELLEGRDISTLIPGAVLSSIGTVFLCVGFVFGSRFCTRSAILSRAFQGVRLDRLGLLLPVLFVVCGIATYFFISQTGASFSGIQDLSVKRRVVIEDEESSLGYYRLLAQDVPRAVLLLLVAAWAARQKRGGWMISGIVAFSLLAIALPFLSSSRSQVLLTVIAACVVVNKVKAIPLSLLAFVFVICIATIFGMLALRRTGSRGQEFTDSMTTMGLEPLFGNHSFADIVKLSHIDEAVPRLIQYKYGSSFINVIFAPVPRTLWAGKPPISMGREITEKMYNRGLSLKDKGGGTPPGLFGESIINFGRFGFALCVLFAGMLLGWLYRSLDYLAARSAAGAALYGGVIPAFCLSMMGGDFSRSLIQGLSTTAIIFCVAISSRFKI